MKLTTFAAVLMTATLAAGCSAGGVGRAPGAGGQHQYTVSTEPAEVPLTADVAEDLQFLREEEKLARDVYTALEAFDPAFTNIRASEQVHMDAVASLLTRYGVADPALGADGQVLPAGQFTNPTLQGLYHQLVAAGSVSREAALAVGTEIEELDLADLDSARAAASAVADVVGVYDQLARGSRNHLRAFHGKLTAEGVSYTPQHLDAAAFEAVVTSPRERGRR